MGIIGYMHRNNILETTKMVLKALNSGEHTINEVADKLKIQWKTAVKCLEFLKEVGLVSERKGEKTYKEERLFRLKL